MEENPPNQIEISFTGDVELNIPAEISPVIFGDLDITNRLWELAGAFDGCTVQVRKATVGTDFGKVDAIKIRVTHPFLLERPMQRWLYRMQEDEVVLDVIENVEFYLKKAYRKQGIGRACLLTEALAANELGFDRIVAIAAGSPADTKNTGWKVWPKVGYDAVIPSDIIAKIPAAKILEIGLDPTKEIRISELFELGVYDLWETYGEGCIMALDVSSLDTWSMKQLAQANKE